MRITALFHLDQKTFITLFRRFRKTCDDVSKLENPFEAKGEYSIGNMIHKNNNYVEMKL